MIRHFAQVIIFLILFATRAGAQETDTLVLHFAFNSHTLSAEAISMLDRYLTRNPQFTRIALDGYCDNKGPDSYNYKLSISRVYAVCRHLQEIARTDIPRVAHAASTFLETTIPSQPPAHAVPAPAPRTPASRR